MAEKTKWTISITPIEDILISTMAEAEEVSKSEIIRRALKDFVEDEKVLRILEDFLNQFAGKAEKFHEKIYGEKEQQS